MLLLFSLHAVPPFKNQNNSRFGVMLKELMIEIIFPGPMPPLATYTVDLMRCLRKAKVMITKAR